ncbi:putative hemolysin [Vibrio ezurae]|uniref:Hemolysin n=1 Tax=Vibrio ezurae NBRC 102218 TaxID=1219080 RepID=U3B2Z6_9VIBR|nr:DUF333 domain-containing protein [Vibrio ezurae]GAD79822.1 hypothetical protein VEZ01S_20_00950 [Vibrio ezurae NBRC 102218]
MKKILLLSMMTGTVLLAGCASKDNEYAVKDWDATTSKAAMYCVQQDYDIIRTTENNSRVTYCALSDSEKYEIWEYYYQNHEDERPDSQAQTDDMTAK